MGIFIAKYKGGYSEVLNSHYVMLEKSYSTCYNGG
jgi:hypothetical protein